MNWWIGILVVIGIVLALLDAILDAESVRDKE